jgi:rhodanese-related sulfurtransferase
MIRSALVLLILLTCAGAAALDVNITVDLEYVDVMHNGRPVRIMRNQDPDHTISERYAYTSRKCPPFCIQPEIIAPGVETIAELEMLQYLKQASAPDAPVLVIDSRTPDWVENGTIPGSVNIPWTTLDTGAGADPFQIADILQQRFGVKNREGLWDFSAARTLVLFCNGNWCGQSPANIRALLALGYPAARLKWYRGGMQNWEMLGFTVVK